MAEIRKSKLSTFLYIKIDGECKNKNPKILFGVNSTGLVWNGTKCTRVTQSYPKLQKIFGRQAENFFEK